MEGIDILVVAAHPDDAEISCAGTLLRHKEKGYSTGILDLTRGELGTRGSAELRTEEAAEASRMLKLDVRENVGLGDGMFENNPESRLRIIQAIRKLRPSIVIANAIHDRHPDHSRAAELVRDACFFSGLIKIETGQEVWRPRAVYHMIQDYYIHPEFVVDITPYWSQKVEVLKCYSSQFYDPSSEEPSTPISGSEFFDFLHARAMNIGRPSGYLLAEGFTTSRAPGVEDLLSLH